MINSRDRINAILDEVESKAYKRGWEDATKELEALALQRLAKRSSIEEAEEFEE